MFLYPRRMKLFFYRLTTSTREYATVNRMVVQSLISFLFFFFLIQRGGISAPDKLSVLIEWGGKFGVKEVKIARRGIFNFIQLLHQRLYQGLNYVSPVAPGLIRIDQSNSLIYLYTVKLGMKCVREFDIRNS